MFIAWSRLSRRTRDISQHLNLKLILIKDRPPYFHAWFETKKVLEKIRPNKVIVQLPQGPLLWRILQFSEKLNYKVIADVHTGFIIYSSLRERILNYPFVNMLKKVDLILSHNTRIKRLLEEKFPEKNIIIVYDPLPKPIHSPIPEKFSFLKEKNYVVFPSSWSPDEPLLELASSSIEVLTKKNYYLVITGNYLRNSSLANKIKKIGKNIVLTGFLNDKDYAGLLRYSKGILALTKREYTVLSAIWESIAYNKPAIVSFTLTLRELLGEQYPCFTNNVLNENLIENCLEKRDKNIWIAFEDLKQKSYSSLNILKKAINKDN